VRNLAYKITFVSDQLLAGYDGMNYYAAQEIGFNYIIDKNHILVNNTLSFDEKIHTIIHEIAEAEHMKQGSHYWHAHTHAYTAENNAHNLANLQTLLQGKI
jgi:predicted metallopeptidase